MKLFTEDEFRKALAYLLGTEREQSGFLKVVKGSVRHDGLICAGRSWDEPLMRGEIAYHLDFYKENKPNPKEKAYNNHSKFLEYAELWIYEFGEYNRISKEYEDIKVTKFEIGNTIDIERENGANQSIENRLFCINCFSMAKQYLHWKFKDENFVTVKKGICKTAVNCSGCAHPIQINDWVHCIHSSHENDELKDKYDQFFEDEIKLKNTI